MRRYLTLARLRCAVEKLREPGSTIERVAEGVGYRSQHNFYAALRVTTGANARERRKLTDAEYGICRIPHCLFRRARPMVRRRVADRNDTTCALNDKPQSPFRERSLVEANSAAFRASASALRNHRTLRSSH